LSRPLHTPPTTRSPTRIRIRIRSPITTPTPPPNRPTPSPSLLFPSLLCGRWRRFPVCLVAADAGARSVCWRTCWRTLSISELRNLKLNLRPNLQLHALARPTVPGLLPCVPYGRLIYSLWALTTVCFCA
jgi:hypothetical protein